MFILTLLFSALIIISVVLILGWVRTPRYRLSRQNVIALLKLILEGRATEHDWRLFSALPLRHDPQLDAVRSRCLEIEDREYVGGRKGGYLFSDRGLAELRDILHELESAED